MPRLCVFGCAATGVGMHKFPNLKKYPEQFKIWVQIVGGKLETEADFEYYKKKRICDLHFDAKDKGNNDRLNPFAVPSHYLVGMSIPSSEDNNQEISSNIENVNTNTQRYIKISGKSAPLEVTNEECSFKTEN